MNEETRQHRINRLRREEFERRPFDRDSEAERRHDATRDTEENER